jgi:hypothetical protein
MAGKTGVHMAASLGSYIVWSIVTGYFVTVIWYLAATMEDKRDKQQH